MRPCCIKPRLIPIGVCPTDAPGVAAIRWYACLSCKKQSPEFIDAKDDKWQRTEPVVTKAIKPRFGPRCCWGEMKWKGAGAATIGGVQSGFNDWSCVFCGRRLRIPVDEVEL